MVEGVQGLKIGLLRKFYFKVDIGGIGSMYFQEVSGLDRKFDIVEYHTNNSEHRKIKMSEFHKTNDITFKKGVFVSDKKIWDWIDEVNMNIVKRHSVTISLMNESDNPMQSWKLINAWTNKITVESFDTDSKNMSIETLIMICEGVLPV